MEPDKIRPKKASGRRPGKGKWASVGNVDHFQLIPKLNPVLPDNPELAERLAPYAEPETACLDCIALAETATQIRVAADKVYAAKPQLTELLRLMLSTQREISGLFNEMGRAQRHLRALGERHACCAACTRLTGAGHTNEVTRQEPFGPELVCLACYADLLHLKTTAELVRDRDGDHASKMRA